jgi:hypothetical protein
VRRGRRSSSSRRIATAALTGLRSSTMPSTTLTHT